MLRRLSVDDLCKDGRTCPSIWVDDDQPDDLVIVGHLLTPSTVPLGLGEVAIRVRRQVVTDAEIR
jgi:hypothetical protein